MIPAHEARSVLSKAWLDVTGRVPSWKALRIALAQSRLEGSWGAWLGANNWGAIQTRHKPPCPPGTVQATDSYPTANGQVKYEVCFKAYPTLADGARDFVFHVKKQRPKSGAAIETGNLRAYAEALYKEHYYGGFGATDEERISGYVKALQVHADIIDRELGLKQPAKSAKSRGPAVAALSLAVAGIGLFSKVAA